MRAAMADPNLRQNILNPTMMRRAMQMHGGGGMGGMGGGGMPPLAAPTGAPPVGANPFAGLFGAAPPQGPAGVPTADMYTEQLGQMRGMGFCE